MTTPSSKLIDRGIHDTLKDVATGSGVKRTQHDLRVGEKDYSETFKTVLTDLGFYPTTVSDAPAEPGERIPAFYIKDSVAYFGWIFYEKYTGDKVRKLWGSVIRNKKGDWAIQLSPKKDITLYANIGQKSEMDIDRPTDW